METILNDYWRSSAAYRVRIGLNLLGIPNSRHAVDLTTNEQRSAENLALNPQGLVPTLQIDGLVLTQSLAILEYLNESRSAGWLPNDAGHRARARALAYAIAMDIHPICNLHVVRHATATGSTTTEGWMQHFITVGFIGLEGMLSHERSVGFCTGGSVSLADICLVPQVYNAHRWGISLTPFPRIVGVNAALSALPAFAAAHPDQVKPRA